MSFHQVTVFHVPSVAAASALVASATDLFGCQGIEEYALSEPEVDALLGERSYSGGDLPLDVLEEVDQAMLAKDVHLKFFFSDEELAQANEFCEWVKGAFLCEVQVETFADQDWNAEWKKHYSPILIGESMVVLPEWISPAAHPEQLVVRIHPGMGFGTGSHETTYLCLKNFMSTELTSTAQKVLDYGSGSGILGIAALLRNPLWLGDFVDIDPEAHRNCRQNLVLHSIDEKRTKMLLVEERDELEANYPVVFANILQNILHQECDYLIGKTAPGGYLILSGLLKGQVEETKNLYLRTGLVSLGNEEIKNDWGCLLMRKNS